MPEWARAAVRWAVDNGILKGDESGLNLDDKDLRYITMMYRMSNMQELIAVQLPHLRHPDLLPY